MKIINVEFRFSKDCPFNLDGTCINHCNEIECGIGKSEPPKWCPLPESANSEIKELLNTSTNTGSTPCQHSFFSSTEFGFVECKYCGETYPIEAQRAGA